MLRRKNDDTKIGANSAARELHRCELSESELSAVLGAAAPRPSADTLQLAASSLGTLTVTPMPYGDTLEVFRLRMPQINPERLSPLDVGDSWSPPRPASLGVGR